MAAEKMMAWPQGPLAHTGDDGKVGRWWKGHIADSQPHVLGAERCDVGEGVLAERT